MDELLERALEERERLRTQLAALDRFIEQRMKLSAPRISRAEERSQLPLWQEAAAMGGSRSERSAAVSRLLDEAEKLILSTGRPMSRGELVNMLQAAGHSLDGQDKSKVFGTNMWRSGRFHNLKGAGYWPRDVELPTEFRDREVRDTSIE